MIAALLLAAAAGASQPACAYEYCAKAKPDVTACKCYGEDDSDGKYTLRIRRGNKIVHESRHDAVNFVNEEIEAHRLDLDADGRPEIVFAHMLGMSNGMGVRYWNLAILDGRTGSVSQLDVVEYGKGTLRRERDGHYTLLETSWDGLDGAHLYFVARPYAYARGALVPQKRRGMWIRRYLFSFERERGRGCRNDPNPAHGCPGEWLRKAKAVTWIDP